MTSIFDRLHQASGNVWAAGLASSTPGEGLVQLTGTGDGENNPAVYVPAEANQILSDPQYNPDISGSPFGRSHLQGGSNWTEVGRPFVQRFGTAVAAGPTSSVINAGSGVAQGSNSPGMRDPNADSHSYSDLVGGGMQYGTNDPNQNLYGGGGLLDFLGNLSPAIAAGYLGNRQSQDVMGQVGRLNTIGDSLSGPAFAKSITDPYDLQTGLGRTNLLSGMQQRNLSGSSFGDQQLNNYDYMRGLGRGDLATRAQAGIASTQGDLYSNALKGIVGNNLAKNQLYGAGLGASGSLFNKGQGLGGSLGGLGGTLGGVGDWFSRTFGGGVGATPDYGPGAPTNPSAPVDFGNDPSLGSGNGLFDWLGQNGGDYGINF